MLPEFLFCVKIFTLLPCLFLHLITPNTIMPDRNACQTEQIRCKNMDTYENKMAKIDGSV